MPEATRATYLRELTAAAPFQGCHVISFAPHTWATPQQDPSNPEDWYGIADPITAKPYPTALAYAEELRGVAVAGIEGAGARSTC